ncbi:adenylyl cyclase [Chytridium lagenaria]|nr:adenylyl cyclase [Chytridium lagenaria]
MKRNEAVQPRQFDNLILLTSDIVSFTSLSSQSSAKQIISLLNRLYSAMDETLDSFHDVFKLETIGDAYCIVAGLNSQDRSPHLNAVDVVECAISFVEIVQNLDMSDQISDSIQMRVGIHCGPAVGGVANSSQPKFSLFGDTTSITGIMEQTSKPNRIHISESLYNLVKDDYEFDVSESVAVQDGAGGKKKMATYWLVGRKQIQRSIDKPTATGSMSKINRIKSGVSRGIRFDQ